MFIANIYIAQPFENQFHVPAAKPFKNRQVD